MGATPTETIIIAPLSVLLPGSTFANETNLLSLSLNYTMTGGTFAMTIMLGATNVPPENAVLSLPFGRVGVVKNTGKTLSSGGLAQTISGPIEPLNATQQTYFGVPGNIFKLTSELALSLGVNVIWATMDVLVRTFIFRGIALQGIQQLASLLLAEIIVRSNAIYVVDPGNAVGPTFSVPSSDLVSISQNVDYSLDIPSELNPALSQVDFNTGTFLYDDQHAQKQPKFTVQCGSPGAQGSTDFIPIPDGWLIDGDFEEWTPATSTDLTNPSASVPRYWKVFPSPTSPGALRGITSFRRLIKQLSIPKNVSTFIGSPITSVTATGTPLDLTFQFRGIEGLIDGFTASGVSFFDAISSQFYDMDRAISLVPSQAVDSGTADVNFYTITMEQWLFPSVGSIRFPNPNFDPTNPFNIPKNVQVVNPSSNVVTASVPALLAYWARYVLNFQRINSPRLRTQISCVYRNLMPQPGDSLEIMDTTGTVDVPQAGRIATVTLNLGRSGVVLNITAEVYNYRPPGPRGFIDTGGIL